MLFSAARLCAYALMYMSVLGFALLNNFPGILAAASLYWTNFYRQALDPHLHVWDIGWNPIETICI